MDTSSQAPGAMPCVAAYMTAKALRLRSLGRQGLADAITSATRSFARFAAGQPLTFSQITTDLIARYEAYLREAGVTRNTSSFYMRVVRSIYNSAVEEGLTTDCHPFRHVYTGIDRTAKRALTLEEMRRLKGLTLAHAPHLEFARDMFLFSFYMRGMSFVDMAYLRKSDLRGGYVHYCRRKTSRPLCVEFTPEMATLVAKHQSTTQFLLPLIRHEDGTEREQYHSRLVSINRNLKHVGHLANLHIPLSTYVSRHSWATIARDKQIPLAVISEALGHDSELTTRIYLNSIVSSEVDRANRLVMEGL